MNRYRRNFKLSFRASVFWLAQSIICGIASWLCAADPAPILSVLFAAVTAVQAFAGMVCADEAWTWHRRDKATRHDSRL